LIAGPGAPRPTTEPGPAIATREAFDAVLARTLTEVTAAMRLAPGEVVWRVLAKQLLAMTQWSSGGRTPTPLERRRISIGTVAARALEPPVDLATHDLCQRLHELQYCFQMVL
jgi:hypothetical protein